ncbi:MAG: ParB/RepB/Spo0J family partition protein [Xylophilus sp.]|nr:ParB/RepB/Spo0J family partition protein [Xylophilus sp.]
MTATTTPTTHQAEATQPPRLQYLHTLELEPSPTNPRKHFAADKLTELADSIRSSGIHQPILARPLPGNRLADTQHQPGTTARRAVLPTHEIVAGERRWRAATIAGLASVPVIIKHMTDDQVLEAQIVENLQRQDLSELEEAEGYRTLIDHTELTAHDIAKKVGKSRSYIMQRLKLLDLGIEGRTALAAHDIDASVALLLARIPDPKRQIEALGKVKRPAPDKRPMSHADAKALILRNYTLRLPDAVFDVAKTYHIKLAGGHPEGHAQGPCQACPNRTGANPDLFADVAGADICTDPACYHAKTAAHQEARLALAQSHGHTVISGKAAKALMPSAWVHHIDGHLRLDNVNDSPTNQPLRAIIGGEMERQGVREVIFANPYKDGETIAALPTAIANKLLKDAAASNTAATAATAKAAVASQAERDQQVAEHDYQRQVQKLQERYELDWRWLLIERTWAVIQEETTGNVQPQNGMGQPYSALQLPGAVCIAAAETLLEALQLTEAEDRMYDMLGLGEIDPHGCMLDYVRCHHYPAAVTLLLIMVNGFAKFDSDRQHGELPGKPAYNRDTCHLELVARECGISAQDAILDTKARIKTELDTLTTAHKERLAAIKATAAEAQTPSLPLNPAAQATGGGGGDLSETKPTKTPAKRNPTSCPPAASKKPKTTAHEAQRDIAAALANLEAPPTEQTTEQRAAPEGIEAAPLAAQPISADTAALPSHDQRPAGEGIEAAPLHHQALPEPEQATTTATNGHPASAGKPFASGTDVWLDGTVAAWVVKHKKVRPGRFWYLLRTSAGATVNVSEDRVTGREDGMQG